MARLKKYYQKELICSLFEELKLKNLMEIPRLDKVVVSMGLGEAVNNSKVIEYGRIALESICGQKPVITKAKKSIATFKLREGQPIGVMVTLRRDRMWEFLDRFINIALPRVRDFRGISSKLDGNGNCAIGVKEHIIFPEISHDQFDKIRGLNVSIVTSTSSDIYAKALLQHLGVPFRKSTHITKN